MHFRSLQGKNGILPRSIERRRLSAAALVGVALTLAAPGALAQDPFGGGSTMFPGQGGSPPPPAAKKAPPKKTDPDMPEMHAASGASDTLVAPGSEPSLPEKPLELSPSAQLDTGSDFDLEDAEQGRSSQTVRRFYGPYYEEESGKYQLRLAFPFWAERKQPSLLKPEVLDRASLYGLYYNRRSNERSDDILFPIFWDLKNKTTDDRTTIVGPLVHREAPDEHDNWLAPLYFTGKRKHGGYTIIPPLLTYTNTNEHGGFNLVGPMFCSWKGGSSCDPRTAEDIDFGIAPLYFFGANAESKYEIIPPLLHYYSYDDRSLSWTNWWGPYYRRHTQKRDALHLFPFFYSLWGKNEQHVTLAPLFHHGYDEKSWLHVNPLFLLGKGSEGESTFVTWGYARYRGRTELDMITPLYWGYRDPSIHLDQKLLFPFYGKFERFGVSKTTFVTPLVQHSQDLRGWSFAIHPLFYLGRSAASTHTVLAPIYWDFAGPSKRTTVAFPAFWRFSDDREVSQLVGNVYYHEAKVSGGKDWQIHVFPAFSYGETPDGHWWNVLYGLAGYTRRGEATQVRTLWIPINTSGSL